QAIERALHHPLLDSINLENATSILANFTAGEDLSFVEVVEALNELQAKANYQAEIIPGVITDPRMHNRAQVILIITGLGATPVEVAIGKMPASEQAPLRPSSPEISISAGSAPVEMAGMQSELDVPAFLRRRIR
ncbi:MAG TPA: hypothetical protein PLV53_07595, partial [Anaerolineaceae bacterium]|nr:hypothetical protein [Anaerolineaceae bacterium]